MIEYLTSRAPAKINLNLHVLGRRSNGYHALDSIVAFTDFGDSLYLRPGRSLSLVVEGETASFSGTISDNLVIKAVRAVQERRAGISTGNFKLIKNLPVAAGIGGGSSDAAAALRLIAKANDLEINDPLIIDAAKATGADVLVCLNPRLSRMRGVGDIVEHIEGEYLAHAVLINPGVAVSTPDVFRALNANSLDPAHICYPETPAIQNLEAYIHAARNDLEEPAQMLFPVIKDVLLALRQITQCTLARMSGSGATVFGLFKTPGDTKQASYNLRQKYPGWWIQAVELN